MDDLDAINRELARVVDALNATADDDFARRHELRTRQDELRARAAAFNVDADQDRSTEDLERELAALQAKYDSIYESGIDLITHAGGGSGTGGSFTSAAEGGLNARIRDAAGLAEIRARIARLSAILAGRDGAGSPAV